jgi:CubicO group peptidase (beta-lactamase class C family)
VTPARAQLDWVVGVLRRGSTTVAEVEQHFDERFLAAVPADKVVAVLSGDTMRDVEPTEVVEHGTSLRAAVGSMTVSLAVEAEPPHRMTGLRLQPRQERLVDDRLVDPPFQLDAVPDPIVAVFREQWATGQAVGLVAAVAKGSDRWTMSAGWADLDNGVAVTPEHRFPAYSVTKLVTAIAVLQLVGEGLIALDDPANQHLRTFRLDETSATVRQLLTHTAGVSSSFEHWVERVPAARDVLGDPVAHDFAPGERYEYSNGGFTVLGQLVEDVRGVPYAEAVTERVLEPLGMTASSFPTSHPGGEVVGHETDEEGKVRAAPRVVPAVPAAGGLWSTAHDLLRLATEWASVLPAEIAEQAITPQADRGSGASIGLGFLVAPSEPKVIGHAGGGVGYASSLLAVPDDGVAAVVLVNRDIGAESLCSPLLRSVGDVD